MGHDHDHGVRDAALTHRRPLTIVLVISSVILVAEETTPGDLPGLLAADRPAALDQILLGARMRRLVVPALLVGEPMLDVALGTLEPVVAQFGLDHGMRLLRLSPGIGVDEQGAVLTRDDQMMALQRFRELLSLWAKLMAEKMGEGAT